MLRTLCLAVLWLPLLPAVHGEESSRCLARCGQGWLEEVGGYPVLHLKGTPYEIGYQHGALLKDRVHSNLRGILSQEEGRPLVEFAGIQVIILPIRVWERQRSA